LAASLINERLHYALEKTLPVSILPHQEPTFHGLAANIGRDAQEVQLPHASASLRIGYCPDIERVR
jgi:hypothetical protein